MTRMRSLGTLAIVLSVGCGGEVLQVMADPTSDGAGGMDASTGGGGEGGATPGPEVVTPELEAWCDTRCEAREGDTCFDRASCAEMCLEGAAGWSEPTRGAFAFCMAEDPLCFVTVEGCMLHQLHGGEGERRVDGTSLGAYEGASVTVWSNTTDPVSTTVQDGAFSVDLPLENAFDQQGGLAMVWIDDGDATCGTGDDVTHAGEMRWTGDFDEPAYVLTVTASSDTDPWICDL